MYDANLRELQRPDNYDENIITKQIKDYNKANALEGSNLRFILPMCQLTVRQVTLLMFAMTRKKSRYEHHIGLFYFKSTNNPNAHFLPFSLLFSNDDNLRKQGGRWWLWVRQLPKDYI